MPRLHTHGLLVAWIASSAAIASAAEPDSLPVLLQLAVSQNPEVEALDAQIAALEERITRASAWSNPILTVAYRNVPVSSFALGQEPMSMFQVQLGQKVPLFGKTRRRAEVVRGAQRAKRHELVEMRSALRRQVSEVYYRLALSRQLRKITEDHIFLVEQLTDAVRIKYEVGRAAQQDLLRLEVLRERLGDDLFDFERSDTQLTAALNAVVHRDVSTRIETPTTLTPPSTSLDVADLIEQAKASRAALAVLVAQADSLRAKADLAEYEAYPDPTLFAGYGLRTPLPNSNPGRDLVTVGISVPLPLFYGSTHGAEARAARAQVRAVEAKRAALVDRISAAIADSVSGWKRAVGKARTYQEQLVPKAHRTLDATFSAYQVDRADFTSLYDAELELLRFEKTIRISIVEALVARARVEWLTGKEQR